jgi:UDP-galactopyranose mutase
VLSRIPIRYSFEEGYFDDPHQALPEGGYTAFCAAMLDHPNITVQLNTDFQHNTTEYEKIFYTGPIDAYFQDSNLPKLEYRSLRFEIEQLPIAYFQENSVINYTDKEVPYTRIIEYKHFLNQQTSNTTIVKEYSSDVGEPYYPIPNPENQALYEKYRQLALKEKDIYFVGRLANYKYFNMDDAILNALELFDTLQMNSIHDSKID